MNSSVRKIGLISGILAAIFAVIYNVAQLFVLAAPPSPPWDLIGLFAPSLFLAWSFIVMMICIHYYAPEERKIYSHIGMVFAIIYATLVSIVYFVELSIVVPQVFQGQTYPQWLSPSSPSMMMSIDALGYGFMSFATLFVSQVFVGEKSNRLIRWAFFANGVMAVVILTAVIIPSVTLVGLIWMITMPLSAIAAAGLFFKSKTELK